jgi:Tol biopolymer transport system component
MSSRASPHVSIGLLTLLVCVTACQNKQSTQVPTVPPRPQVGGEGSGPPPPPATVRSIIYQRNHGGTGGPWDLRRMDEDGTNDVELIADGNYNIEPAWNCRNKAFAFVSNRSGDFLIYISDDGVGGGVRQVTSLAAGFTGQHDRYPSWQTSSLGVDQIVFTSNRPSQSGQSGVFQLYQMRSTGRGLHQLQTSGGNDSQPVWKPGTNFVAYSSDQADSNFEIHTVEAGTSNTARITHSPAKRDVHPTWSVHDQIAYESSNPEETETSIVMSPAGGGDPRTLKATSTLIPRNVDPAFSPDGDTIVFAKQDQTGQFDLFTMDANGGNEKQLTTTPDRSEREPEWIHGPNDDCF